ncbi:MAG: CsgE family curli-type amyloid fiber assembly protein [Glaciecola sp.]
MTSSYSNVVLIIALVLAIYLPNCNAQSTQAEIDISGLVLDNTISRQGHDFTTQLSRFWQEVPNTFGRNVVVNEIIVPQAGTRLDVVFDNKIVYRTYLGRRLLPLDEKVGQAVYLLVDAVARSQEQSSSPDLADDEF